ncbi:MAG: GntR family transcriptional regulator [Firmicutes bacterium]|nr:GntR family transcriptional regulator [Bacillota bacterium]
MAFELSRKSGIPLYIQLKNQIRQQIESNAWRPGFQLPTERQLASLLGVSRNTVSMAYQELEAEGELVSYQGKGTFVAEAAVERLSESRKQRLQRSIDDLLDTGASLGFSADEILEMVRKQVEAKQQLLNRIKIAFIECNREQVDYFARQLELESGVSITPLVLGEIRNDLEYVRAIAKDVDLVVTTFFHQDEVRAMIPAGCRVLAIALDPHLETIVRIARIPRNKRLGLVCLSTNFAEKVVNSIRSAGIDYLPIETTIALDETSVQGVIERSDVLLVSPGRRREVEKLCPEGKEVIEFVYRPDQASVNLLKTALLEFKSQQARKEGV